MKTIFNTYIRVESQEQADRLKQICIDNGLPIWGSFYFLGEKTLFINDYEDNDFLTTSSEPNIIKYNEIHEEVTESEWLELLKQHQCTK